ncbi:hypothetical protein [Streptomyces sp. NPDC048639]
MNQRKDDDEEPVGMPADDVDTADEEPEDEPADAWLMVDDGGGSSW